VSVGDEGFLNGGGSHGAYKANDGVDHEALTALPGIDFGTFHLYPEDWGATLEWGDDWIKDHLRVARRLGKPTVLEEYGTKVMREHGKLGKIVKGWRERYWSYARWNEIMLQGGGNGSLVWMLAGNDNVMPRYPDYDSYAFWQDSQTGVLLSAYADKYPAAPACQNAGGKSGSSSPFVRARGPAGDKQAARMPNSWML
jgi:mannan endo-1,4-beta-mannosidase